MTLQEALTILTIHQQWRLGADIEMAEPKVITEALDVILSLFAKIDEKINEQNQDKNDFYDFINSLPGDTNVLAVNEFGKPTSLQKK